MIGAIGRIPHDAVRIPLLVLAWPFEMAGYVLSALMPVRIGGHPDKSRILDPDFYALPVALFWAAWDGEFVENGRNRK